MSSMNRIKSTEVRDVRAELLRQQGGGCAICGNEPAVPHLDHRHPPANNPELGYIRGVLCSNHNMFLGKIENSCARYLVPYDTLPMFLRQVADYLELHSVDQTGLIHPTVRTKDEKVVLAKKRAKRKANERKSTATKRN